MLTTGKKKSWEQPVLRALDVSATRGGAGSEILESTFTNQSDAAFPFATNDISS